MIKDKPNISAGVRKTVDVSLLLANEHLDPPCYAHVDLRIRNKNGLVSLLLSQPDRFLSVFFFA